MQLSTAGNLEALGAVGVFHTKADICIQLSVKTVAQMTGGDIFAFLACKRAVIYDKVHGNGRLGDFLERNGFRIITTTEGIADMNF